MFKQIKKIFVKQRGCYMKLAILVQIMSSQVTFSRLVLATTDISSPPCLREL